MKGVAWSKYYERIEGHISVAGAIIDIWDTDELSEQIKLNSDWWDYNYNGNIEKFQIN